MKQSVLLSVRAGEDPEAAIRYALALCRDLGARLVVLTVAEADPENTHWLCVQEKLREETEARMFSGLEAARALAAGSGVECTVEGSIGDFSAEVEAWAERHQPHLVLVTCPRLRAPSLRRCQEMILDLRGRLSCPVVSLVPGPASLAAAGPCS